MILPAIGERCSCGHTWTEEEVKRIWKRSPVSDHIDTIKAVVFTWMESILLPPDDRRERLAFFSPQETFDG